VAVICLDAANRKSVRLWGNGEVFSSGELFDRIGGELAARGMKARNVVKIAVDEVEVV
jgi:hypothetical protein